MTEFSKGHSDARSAVDKLEQPRRCVTATGLLPIPYLTHTTL